MLLKLPKYVFIEPDQKSYLARVPRHLLDLRSPLATHTADLGEVGFPKVIFPVQQRRTRPHLLCVVGEFTLTPALVQKRNLRS